jgi:hypothetical protein
MLATPTHKSGFSCSFNFPSPPSRHGNTEHRMLHAQQRSTQFSSYKENAPQKTPSKTPSHPQPPFHSSKKSNLKIEAENAANSSYKLCLKPLEYYNTHSHTNCTPSNTKSNKTTHTAAHNSQTNTSELSHSMPSPTQHHNNLANTQSQSNLLQHKHIPQSKSKRTLNPHRLISKLTHNTNTANTSNTFHTFNTFNTANASSFLKTQSSVNLYNHKTQNRITQQKSAAHKLPQFSSFTNVKKCMVDIARQTDR